jgi:DNA-binding CsgD family transcriptional regulator
MTAPIMVAVRAEVGSRLYDRGHELRVVDSLIERVRVARGGLAVVTGPGGIGKTRFLAAVEERANDAAIGVFTAAGAEFERGLAFGGVAQLFEPTLRRVGEEQRAALFDGAARLGGELLGFGDQPQAVGAGDNLAAFHGLYWLCANLARDSPIALLVDDAHWLDDRSLAWIEYLARRLDGLSVLIVVATRVEEPDAERLVQTAMDSGGEVLELVALSRGAVSDLLECSLDEPADPVFGEAFQDATRGNPFLVHELLRTIRRERVPLDAQGAQRLEKLGSDRIGRAVLTRLHRLSPAAVDLARAIAILGRARSLTLAARLADLDEATAVRAMDALIAADVLAAGSELLFHHPVVRSSVYLDMPAPARALRHRQAARLLAEFGASPPEVASQLLEAEPAGDPWAVAMLRSAAHDAVSRGAPRSAIPLLERALAEFPGTRNPELLLELGRTAHAALEIPKAINALTGALESPVLSDRGAATLELARVLLHAGRGDEAVGLLKTELEHQADIESELRLWLEIEYVLYAGPGQEAFACANRFRALSGRTAAELAALAMAASMASTAEDAASLARQSLAGGALLCAPEGQSAWFMAPWMLVRAERLDEAVEHIELALEHARRNGWQVAFARASWLAAEVDYRRGDLLGAEASLRSAFSAASEGGSLWVRLMSGALLAQVLADRGGLAEADAILSTLDISMLPPRERLTRPVRYARGYVALLSGNPRTASDEFDHVDERLGIAPAGRSRFAAGMVVRSIALSMCGRLDEARRLADEELAWAESWQAPRFIGIALRGRAHSLVGIERIDELERSVAVLAQTPASLDLARALADLGMTCRRENKRVAAREPLRKALDVAHHCRADGFAAQLRDELRAVGARPRRDALSGRDSLTASEARIAEMAASGMTNSRIAQALFVTPGTVEKHLTSVYAKLGISSRRHLATTLRTDAAEADTTQRSEARPTP